MLSTKFWFIWSSSFRGENFQRSANEKKKLPLAAMLVCESGRNQQSLQRTFHRCFLPNFSSFGIAVSEEKIFFRNQPIRNKNGLWQPCLLTDRDEMSKLYRGPSIDASYQVSVQLAKQFQGRRFLEIDQSETRIACGGLMFVNESGRNRQSLQRTFHRCFLPNFSSFGIAVSEEKIFLEINQSETRIACGGHVC